MDADVIKVRLLQEVVLALGSHTIHINSRAHPRAHQWLESGGSAAHRGGFLLLPTLARLGLGLLGLGLLLHLLGTFSPLSDSWSWNTNSSSIISAIILGKLLLNN